MKKRRVALILSTLLIVSTIMSGCSVRVNFAQDKTAHLSKEEVLLQDEEQTSSDVILAPEETSDDVILASEETLDDVILAPEETSEDEIAETEEPSDDMIAEPEGEEKVKEDRTAIMVKDIMADMTLREKIGQMIMVSARKWSDTPEDAESYVNSTEFNEQQIQALQDYSLGGVCLFSQNIVDTEQTVRLTNQIQNAAVTSGVGGIKAFISIDQEGGYVTRVATGTSGIGNMALAATDDPVNASIEAQIIGEELGALGINIDFAPDADVNSNPDNPVIGVRSFSDDPKVVSEYVKYFLDGLNKTGTINCLKHFPGHGDTDTDSHTGFPIIDKSYDELKEIEFVPFADNCEYTDMIMTAHIQFPQIEKGTYVSTSTGEEVYLPATMSKTFISDILRNEMGYDGVVVTDALEMDAISANFDISDAAQKAIMADVDILLMPYDLTNENQIVLLGELIDSIETKVNEGVIPEAQLDNSVERILRLKIERGLVSSDNRTLDDKIENALEVVGCEENHNLEWDMALAAVTEYKNDGVLPLSKKARRSILYLSATKGQILAPTFAMRKLDAEYFSTKGIKIVAETYRDREFEDIESQIDEANLIILTTATDSLKQTDINNPDNKGAILCQKVIERAHEQGKKVIVISTQLPYDAEFYSNADAVLLCYNPAGMDEVPSVFDGKVKKYGANVPAAMYKILQRWE